MIIVPITEPNPYATSTDIQEAAYTPNTAELAVVGEMIRQGCPETVQFVEWTPTSFSWKTHLIRFVMPPNKKFECESHNLLAWPHTAYNEMKVLGMVK